MLGKSIKICEPNYLQISANTVYIVHCQTSVSSIQVFMHYRTLRIKRSLVEVNLHSELGKMQSLSSKVCVSIPERC